MTGSLEFIVVMALLYLVECFRRVGSDELTLDHRTRSGFRLKQPATYPNNTHWGWVFLNPFRPGGPAFSQTASVVALTDHEQIGDEAFLRNLDPARFDVDGINAALALIAERTCGIRGVALALLVVCFGIFPVCLFFFGLKSTLPPAAAAIFMGAVCVAVLYHDAARLITPDMLPVDLYGNMLKLGLCPISAVRCMDTLCRNALATFDPIAVATVLCGREEGARLAASELTILQFVVTDDADWGTSIPISEYRAARLQLLRSFATQQGLPVQSFLDPPVQSDDNCRTYCPVCREQFRQSEGVCSDCPNILLQPICSPTSLQTVCAKEETHA